MAESCCPLENYHSNIVDQLYSVEHKKVFKETQDLVTQRGEASRFAQRSIMWAIWGRGVHELAWDCALVSSQSGPPRKEVVK